MTLERIYEKTIEGDIRSVENLISNAIEDGAPAMSLITEYLSPAMREVGHKFEVGELFIPEMMVSAQAMLSAMEILEPHLTKGELTSSGTLVAGTVQGDLHNIGISLVCMLMKAAGFEVHNLGVDVSADAYVQAVSRYRPQILAMSALLTTTMPMMKQTLSALEEVGLRKELFVMVGGAPVTKEFADQIGADGYARDATGAVRRAKELLGLNDS